MAIVDREPLTDADAIRRVLAEASADEECIGVIAWMHTFSPARMWIGGLNALRKPLLHLHTQFDRELPWGQIDMDYMNLNQSAHGDREFAYIESRMGVSRKTVVGHWSDRLVQERIGTWIRAACGWQEAQRLRIARFGDNMRDVAVTEGDKVGAQITLGATVNGYGVDGLSDAVEHARGAAVDELLERYDDEYDARGRAAARRRAPRVTGPGGADRGGPALGAARRGLRRLHRHLRGPGPPAPASRHRRAAADGRRLRVRRRGRLEDGAAAARAQGDGRGCSGGTSFMEDYVYHLGPGPAKVLGAHMLEICPSIAAARPSCEIHPLSIGGREDPVRLVFTAPPGQAVMVCLIDVGGRLRLVANQVDVVAPDEELPRLPVARAVWEPRPDLSTAAEAWLMAGGSHHSVFTTALKMEALHDLAEIAGIELVVIDEDTTIPQFANELRWNRAYYHLARGL